MSAIYHLRPATPVLVESSSLSLYSLSASDEAIMLPAAAISTAVATVLPPRSR